MILPRMSTMIISPSASIIQRTGEDRENFKVEMPPLQIPIGYEDSFSGIIDLLLLKASATGLIFFQSKIKLLIYA